MKQKNGFILLLLCCCASMFAQQLADVDILIRQQRYSEALQLTTIQLRTRPRDGQLYAQRAWLYRRLQQPGMAILDIDHAIKYASSTDMTESQLYHTRGQIHAEIGMLIDAYEDYTISIEEDKNCAQCYADRAETAIALDYYPLAVQDYEQALQLESYNTAYRVEYARALLSNAQLEEAAVQLRRVLAQQPDMLEAKRLLATYHFLQNEPELYIDLYLDFMQQYYEINHKPSEADHLLYSLQDSAAYHYLFSALDTRIRHTTGDIQVMFLFLRAHCRYIHSDFTGAISDLSQLISASQDYDYSALRLRAESYMQCSQYEPALRDYTALISYLPRSTAAYYGRSMAYRYLNQIDEAISDLLSVTRLNYREAPQAFYEAARLAAEQNKLSLAIQYLSRAIELAPAEASYYLLRAELYEAQGNSYRAEMDYRIAQELIAQ